jgi:von Willebrand factor A domain-containing protein 7
MFVVELEKAYRPMRTASAGMSLALAICCGGGPWVAGFAAAPQSSQQNRSRSFGPGQCGPVDPVYIQMANETGGQPFFMNPLEVANSAHIMRVTSRSNNEMVLWASGTTPDGARELKVPVDSTTRRVTFSASFDTKGGELTILGPKGVVTGRDERTEDTISTCSRIVTVDAPQGGAWQATLMATGRFWLVVHAESDLSLETAEFVRPGGRPGHEGLFRIHGQPIAGEPATLRTRVGDSETFKTAAFALHSQDGREIRRIELTAAGDGEFVGRIDLPQQPFRVTASGVDASGLPYQRMHAGLFHGELVEVTPTSDVENVAPGTTATLTFAVRNAGPPATFAIVAVDGHGFVRRVEPQSIALDTGAVGTIRVAVSVPQDATVRGGVDVTVTATSSGSRTTSNGTSRHLTVGAEQAVR